VRDDGEQWYRSLIRFHGNLFAGGRIPTKTDLLKAAYCYPGFVFEAVRLVWNTPEDDLYHKPTMISHYERHNADVRDYFRFKSNLLEVNLSDKESYTSLCEFLGKTPVAQEFPRLNESSPLTIDKD
ncbi:MAG TPA: sulfotransferase, partial [Pyrinomonadaceae bacterium]|nr:sulfotransferase [Pyrinomonadaceae bacterium]